jgi:hypothetical protein
MNINAALAGLGNIAKGVTGLGLALIPTALVVDVIYPGTTNIVANLGHLVESFTGEGLTGLVVLLLVLAIVD